MTTANEVAKSLDIAVSSLCSIAQKKFGFDSTRLTKKQIETIGKYLKEQRAAGKKYTTYNEAMKNYMAARHGHQYTAVSKNVQKETSKKENTYDYTVVAEVLEIAPQAIYNTARKLHMNPEAMTEKNVIALRTYIESRKEQGRTYGKIRATSVNPNVPEVPEVPAIPSQKKAGRPVGSKAKAKLIITVKDGVSVEVPISRDQVRVLI